MKGLRNRFERFCFKHRSWGIPNLMLFITLGSALVYLFTLVTDNMVLYSVLAFDWELILRGQVWRLISYALCVPNENIFFTLISLVCYYSLGRAMENIWGTFRFNLFYFTGIVLMDVFAMVVGIFMKDYLLLWESYVNVSYLNMSLFLGYATLYPDAQFLFMFIIPVKARIFALVDLVLVAIQVILYPFPLNLFPLIPLANYFLFFGKEVLNLLPVSWRANSRRLLRKKKQKKEAQKAKTIPFPTAGSYEATVATPKAPYNHRCTVCGRTDVSNPELEFRYCSRCAGYSCYCQEHINNHIHIQ